MLQRRNNMMKLGLRLRIAAACLALYGISLASADLPSLSSYGNSYEFDPQYTLYWTADTSAAKPKMSFAVRAQTKGFVALGISEVGGMVGSDAMVGWVTPDGQVTITDRFIFTQKDDGSGVRLDVQQDWVAVGGEESVNGSTGETWTTIHFWRYLDTGDVNDRPLSNGRLTQLVWSFGPYDQLSYHGTENRGSADLLLIPPPGPPRPTPSKPEYHINLTFDNYHVPNAYTTYVCKKFEVDITQPLHVIQKGVVISGSHPSAVHHYILNACTKEDWDKAPNTDWECLESQFLCGQWIAGWAVGGMLFNYPADVGMRISDENRYLVLQMHYTNPQRLSNIVDSSGVSLGVTTQLRKYDGGFMRLGPVQYQTLIRIPQRKRFWTQETSCTDACTNAEIVADKSIFLFSTAPHMHTIGRRVSTRVIRDGVEVFSAGQEYFDFNFQQYSEIYPPFEIKRGDVLKTTCLWDSSARPTATWGGPSTKQEMCLHSFQFYPRSSAPDMFACLDVCLTHPIPPIPYFLPQGSPMFAPKGVKGKETYWCKNQLWTNNETCRGQMFGFNKPAPRKHGRMSRTLCSTCTKQLSLISKL